MKNIFFLSTMLRLRFLFISFTIALRLIRFHGRVFCVSSNYTSSVWIDLAPSQRETIIASAVQCHHLSIQGMDDQITFTKSFGINVGNYGDRYGANL